jgi:hypothetical protein
LIGSLWVGFKGEAEEKDRLLLDSLKNDAHGFGILVKSWGFAYYVQEEKKA